MLTCTTNVILLGRDKLLSKIFCSSSSKRELGAFAIVPCAIISVYFCQSNTLHKTYASITTTATNNYLI